MSKGSRNRTADHQAYREGMDRIFGGRCCCDHERRLQCAACPLHGCGARNHTAHPRTHAFGTRGPDGGIYPIVTKADIP